MSAEAHLARRTEEARRYHIDVFGHYYSVPYTLVRKPVDVRITTAAVEILFDGKRVASHLRSRRKGGFTTDPAHRPKAHQKHLEWTPSRILRWAGEAGVSTAALAARFPGRPLAARRVGSERAGREGAPGDLLISPAQVPPPKPGYAPPSSDGRPVPDRTVPAAPQAGAALDPESIADQLVA